MAAVFFFFFDDVFSSQAQLQNVGFQFLHPSVDEILHHLSLVLKQRQLRSSQNWAVLVSIVTTAFHFHFISFCFFILRFDWRG